MAVAGRTDRSYGTSDAFTHSAYVADASGVATSRQTVTEKMPRPPNGDGGLGYMKGGSPPWGGLGGYPFTPWERALGARGESTPSCMRRVYRPRRVIP
jgi:hypothetical protein